MRHFQAVTVWVLITAFSASVLVFAGGTAKANVTDDGPLSLRVTLDAEEMKELDVVMFLAKKTGLRLNASAPLDRAMTSFFFNVPVKDVLDAIALAEDQAYFIEEEEIWFVSTDQYREKFGRDFHPSILKDNGVKVLPGELRTDPSELRLCGARLSNVLKHLAQKEHWSLVAFLESNPRLVGNMGRVTTAQAIDELTKSEGLEWVAIGDMLVIARGSGQSPDGGRRMKDDEFNPVTINSRAGPVSVTAINWGGSPRESWAILENPQMRQAYGMTAEGGYYNVDITALEQGSVTLTDVVSQQSQVIYCAAGTPTAPELLPK